MASMLIVDDDLRLRKLVLTYAQMENYQCREAENGDQALSLLREEAADIIILDVMMPGKDGFETLGELRQFTQAPVIMLTARGRSTTGCWASIWGRTTMSPSPSAPRN